MEKHTGMELQGGKNALGIDELVNGIQRKKKLFL